MARRVFLNNSTLIRAITRGKKILRHHYNHSGNSAYEYNVGKKREKAIAKLVSLVKKEEPILNKFDFNKYWKILQDTPNIEVLIGFIECKVMHSNDVKSYFETIGVT